MTPMALTYKEHAKATLKLGLPLILGNLAQFAIHMTDTIMLGWYDVTALAAATIATSLFFVTFILGAGFAQAVTPLVAAASEAGDDTTVRRATRMGLWLSIFYGAVIMIPFFWSEPILLAIGQTPEVAAEAHRYLVIVAIQMVPMLIGMVLRSFLVAVEHAAIILWATIGAAVLNVAVNYALIFGNWGAPEMGIQGAAVASLVVTLVSTAILLAYALKVLPQYDLLRNPLRPDPQIMSRVFRLGWPIGLTSLAEGGLFSASAVMMGWIGEIPLAAHGIAIQLASLTFMVHIGLSQAATVRAGRALGRDDEKGLRDAGKVGIALSLAFALATVAVFLSLPELLISSFLDPDEPARDAVLQTGVVLLALAALFQVVDAAQVMALGLLRGVQDTRVPMVIATISYWIIGLPVSYVLAFPLELGGPGLWLGLVVGLTFAAVLLHWRFWTRSVHITKGAPAAAPDPV